MQVTIEPEPSPEERAAILEALGAATQPTHGEWGETALAEGVAADEADPYPVSPLQR